MCRCEDKLKAGKNISLVNLAKKCAKYVEAHFLVQGDTDKAAKVQSFRKILSMSAETICGDASCTLGQKRQKQTKKPGKLPLAEYIHTLNVAIDSDIKQGLECTINNGLRA